MEISYDIWLTCLEISLRVNVVMKELIDLLVVCHVFGQIWYDIIMLFQEVSKNIISWRNSISSPNINFKEKNTKEDEEKGKNVLKEGVVHPRHAVIRPRCAK